MVRERAEAALRESEMRARAVVETAVDAIMIIDHWGAVQAFNRAGEEMLGYRAEEVIGQNVSMLMPAQQRAAHDGYIQSYLDTEEVKVIGIGREVTGRRRDGTEFPLELSVSDVSQDNDRAFVGILRDITKRKRAEEEIHRLNGDLERRVEERTEELSGVNRALEHEMGEHSQAQAELLVRAYQQDVVVKLGRDALANSDLAALMNRATALVSQTLEIEYCSILELLRNGERFWLCAGAGWGSDLVGQTTVDAGTETPAGLALRSGEPVIIEDLSTEERFSDVSILVAQKVVSGVSVIIDGRDRAFGVLEAHSTGFRPFSDTDIAFLQAVSNVLSAAVERKRAEDAHEQLTEQLYQSQNGGDRAIGRRRRA